MDTMLKFKRLSCLSENKEEILEALKKSSSELVEVSENGIRRHPNLKVPNSTAEVNSAYEDQCLYVKGFPLDLSLDEIIDYLEKGGLTTLNVNMRRFPAGSFKGSIFVTFKSKDDAEKFLTAEEYQKYNDKDLIRKWQRVYFSDKRAEREQYSQKNAKRKADAQSDRNASVISRMTHGALLELSGLPPASSKQKNTDENSETNKSEDEGAAGENHIAGVKRKADYDSTEKAGMHVSELKNWLKEQLDGVPVAWVDVFPAESRAIVRFKEENSANNAWNKLIEKSKPPKSEENEENGNEKDPAEVIYSGHSLSGRVLTGNEEVEYWINIFASMNRKNSNRGYKKRRAY